MQAVTPPEQPTLVKLQTKDFLRKILKLFIVIIVINFAVVSVIAILAFNGLLQNYYDYQATSIDSFEILLIYEGAFFILAGSITLTIRSPKNDLVKDETKEGTKQFNNAHINQFLTREFVLQRSNVFSVVGILSGLIFLVLSAFISFFSSLF